MKTFLRFALGALAALFITFHVASAIKAIRTGAPGGPAAHTRLVGYGCEGAPLSRLTKRKRPLYAAEESDFPACHEIRESGL